ncbi:hypothetical protein IEI94_15040 [Halomonas sp. ML-15]|uniref:hypothetical protein n=1 Tax=Halomonas sp. ML-15 TaxID=2773305 RepID=UPI0017463F68|nr:hypothetical protein [Halomonas sp. ML-15]MBD3897172.1 hypothetical protein [Halomonas sp. ML-15]
MHQAAAEWVVGLLRQREIPFVICGGLAAQGYGAKRPLHDIDLFVPGEVFSSVVEAGQAYISKGAAHYREEGWDLTYVQFKYEGIKVEVGSADGAHIFDASRQAWVPLAIDVTRVEMRPVLGMDLPLMPKDDLIRYKRALSRPVDIEDIRAIEASP